MPNASGRRHKQALNNFTHWDKRSRPKYKRRDAKAAAEHNAAMLQRERERQHRKALSNKK
jgi:hypothetical protein